MSTAERRVFLEQAFLHVEAEGLGFLVFIVGGNFADGEFIDRTISKQHFVDAICRDSLDCVPGLRPARLHPW